VLRFFLQFHLPKSGKEIQSGENAEVCSAYVPNAFGDFFHGVFVDMGILV
jgi:hypothetical protein